MPPVEPLAPPTTPNEPPVALITVIGAAPKDDDPPAVPVPGAGPGVPLTPPVPPLPIVLG